MYITMKQYTFYKQADGWFIDLPQYIAQGGHKGDLEMVEGADKMLDIMSSGKATVTVNISKEQFDGADVLVLKEKCAPPKNGGVYVMPTFEGKEINLTLWLCKVTAYVLGEIPEKIFIQRKKI